MGCPGSLPAGPRRYLHLAPPALTVSPALIWNLFGRRVVVEGRLEDGPLDDEPLGECRVILVYRSRPELPARRLYGARATGLFIKSPFTAGNVVRG